jgi:two-component system, NarL family, sensor kinase
MLFRVLQETLNNIHRHSGSDRAEVKLELNGNEVILEVRDFGHGIQSERLERFRKSGTGVGVGLAGIRERVSELGGSMRIQSSHGGTCIRISVPRRVPDSMHNRSSAAD